MKPITNFMEQDHDRLDGLFKDFQAAKNTDTVRAKGHFADFKRGLQRHIVWEEEFLFPRFEERTGAGNGGPTSVMRLEHRRIKGLLEAIHDRVVAKRVDTDEYERELKDVLMVHNAKEESILYPGIDGVLSEGEAANMITAMQALPAERYTHCCSGAGGDAHA